jgi:S-DNA-T family DNA segregation ATPase FtsK/SpoIIIE
MRNTPDELKLMLIDPKKVEFSKYANLPHLLCPIITDAKEGKEALKRLVQEMERRYEMLSEKGASKISEYNEFAELQGFEKMPNIVLVCDEFSDFMSEYGKEIEQSVKRLAQKARACGIYLIICTQRPSVNVITGDIKAVVPSRIGLLVPQYVDSKTILDEGGAESLLGNGDMLCRIPRHNSLVRVQGAFISGVEILQICQYIKDQVEVCYDRNFLDLVPQQVVTFHSNGERRKEIDELHEECKAHVIKTRIASTSNLQSNFGIGYARADHILNCLEEEGVVKRVNGGRRIVVATGNDSTDEQENL